MRSFTCLTCSNNFKSEKFDKQRTPKYCSKDCFIHRKILQSTLEKMSQAKIGKPPWNKGVQMWKGKEHPKGTLGKTGLGKGRTTSEETKLKQRNSLLGKKLPERSGENHPMWKGGITPVNEKIRKSSDYSFWRKSVFERDKYSCTMCSKIGGNLHADHILPFCAYPELRFEVINGRTLCVECHRKTDTYGHKASRKVS